MCTIVKKEPNHIFSLFIEIYNPIQITFPNKSLGMYQKPTKRATTAFRGFLRVQPLYSFLCKVQQTLISSHSTFFDSCAHVHKILHTKQPFTAFFTRFPISTIRQIKKPRYELPTARKSPFRQNI